MGILNKKKAGTAPQSTGVSVQTGSLNSHPFRALNSYTPMSLHCGGIYRALREGIPVIDSAINKIVRLTGGFSFEAKSEATARELNEFFENVNVGGNRTGIQSFIDTYLEQLLTYGSAVGEMLCNGNGFYALYNGELEALEIKRKNNSLDVEFYNVTSGSETPIPSPEKLLFSVLNPEPGQLLGTSLLRGLPFVCDILLKIFNTVGTNWERMGNLRYAVTYKPQSDTEGAFAKERAAQMAEAWRDAMNSRESVKDFVAVGDVKISVIGADNQILDSEVPVRQLMEQIIAKTGLMPYMLGLNWSTSERMSLQQADILTTELEAYRRILTPIIKKIARTYLSIRGIYEEPEVIWDDITLQDGCELARARLYNAQADKLLKEAENDSGKN